MQATWEAFLPGSEIEQNQLASIPVGDVGRVDDEREDETLRVHQDVPLASLQLLAAVIAREPPFAVVLTDWLSRIATLGLTSRPARRRACSRQCVWTRSQVPSRHQSRK